MTLNIDESRNALRYTDGAAAGRAAPAFIWIHHWGSDGQTHDGILDWFCDNPGVQTSAHFVVSAGRVNCIVSTVDVAWHAGEWGVNLVSIGIECRPEATDADYQTVAELISYLRGMYGDLPLRPHNIKRQGTDGGWGSAYTDCPGRYDLNRLDRMARAGGTAGQATDITPIPSEEDDMTPAQEAMLNETMLNVRKIVGMEQADATRDQIAAGKLDEVVGNARKTVYGIGDLKAGLAKMPATDIAAAIPKDMAAQVIAALSAQLKK